MDMQGEVMAGSSSITNCHDQTTDMLMPQQHMYMEFKPISQTAHQPGMAPEHQAVSRSQQSLRRQKGTTCKNLGVEQVNGRTCDHWQVIQKDGNVSNVWVDQKLHFPIKTVTKEDTWELTNIEEGEPDATLFEIPPGYRKIDLSGMPQGKRPPGQ